jgi:hypothetical protein
MTIHVAPVEYVIVRKLEYFRERGSEKHVRDIRAMIEVSGSMIDQSFIDVWIAKLHLPEAWARVIGPHGA